MATVEFSVTPGKVFGPTEEVTYDKLNQLGAPTVEAEIDSEIGESSYLRNGQFHGWTWSGGTVSTPVSTTNFAGCTHWIIERAAGGLGNVVLERSVSTPDTKSRYSVKLTGATSAAGVCLLQRLEADVASQMRRILTFSAWIYNGSGASVTPSLRLRYPTSADNDFSSPTTLSTTAMQECLNGVWRQVTATVDLSADSGLDRGIEVGLLFPNAALNSAAKNVFVSRMRLQTGSVVTDYTEAAWEAPCFLPGPGGVSDGRLSAGLDAVPTTDQLAVTVLRYGGYKGNRVMMPRRAAASTDAASAFAVGSLAWAPCEFPPGGLAMTLSVGDHLADNNYDVFLFTDTTGLLRMGSGPAWTNATTRSAAISGGAGAGYVNSANISLMYDGITVVVPARRALLVGTFRTTANGQTEDSTSKRYVANMYNRVRRVLRAIETTNSWNYTTATWREANGGSTFGTSRVGVVLPLGDEYVEVMVLAIAEQTGGNPFAAGVGLNSTTVNSAPIRGSKYNSPSPAYYEGYPGVGHFVISWLEISTASGTTTWIGDNNTTIMQSGMTVKVEL